MPQSTAVKYFRHSDAGAPTLTGAAGDMVALLHACLVTGYNVSAVDSITRDGTTVTVTVNAGHGLEQGVVAEISGADQTEYNGEHRITTATADTFEFELEAAETPATPATGTIEVRMAPAGWERSFVSGDNQRAAFKSLAVDATGMYLYIDDTNNQGTRRTGVKGYESMTDIDTGINPFPYSSADDQWYWWYKSADETSALRWAVVADDKWFYLWWNRATDSNESYGRLNAFGDLISYVPADVWHCLVTGEHSITDEAYQSMLATAPLEYSAGAVVNQSGVSIARDYLGVGDSKMSGAIFPAVTIYIYSSRTICNVVGGYGVDFPSHITGGAIVAPVDAVEVCGSGCVLRGRNPGMYSPFHMRPYSRIEPELVQGTGDLADRRFLSLPFAGGVLKMSAGSSTYTNYHKYGQALIDVIGPWR